MPWVPFGSARMCWRSNRRARLPPAHPPALTMHRTHCGIHLPQIWPLLAVQLDLRPACDLQHVKRSCAYSHRQDVSSVCNEVVQGSLGVMAAPLVRAGAGVVLEVVRAEFSNPAMLFLIGSYPIGKERLYLEVASILQCKARILAYMAIVRLTPPRTQTTSGPGPLSGLWLQLASNSQPSVWMNSSQAST